MPVIYGGEAQNRTEDTRIFSHFPRASRTSHQYVSCGNDSISIFHILADFPRFGRFWKYFLTLILTQKTCLLLVVRLESEIPLAKIHVKEQVAWAT